MHLEKNIYHETLFYNPRQTHLRRAGNRKKNAQNCRPATLTIPIKHGEGRAVKTLGRHLTTSGDHFHRRRET